MPEWRQNGNKETTLEVIITVMWAIDDGGLGHHSVEKQELQTNGSSPQQLCKSRHTMSTFLCFSSALSSPSRLGSVNYPSQSVSPTLLPSFPSRPKTLSFESKFFALDFCKCQRKKWCLSWDLENKGLAGRWRRGRIQAKAITAYSMQSHEAWKGGCRGDVTSLELLEFPGEGRASGQFESRLLCPTDTAFKSLVLCFTLQSRVVEHGSNWQRERCYPQALTLHKSRGAWELTLSGSNLLWDLNSDCNFTKQRHWTAFREHFDAQRKWIFLIQWYFLRAF